jgi:hypothetical protein
MFQSGLRPARTRRKVVQFLSVTDGIEFDYGVVSDEQKDFGRTAGTELVFVHRAWQFYPLGQRGADGTV